MNKRVVLGERIKTIQNKILGFRKEELPAKQAESAETSAAMAATAKKAKKSPLKGLIHRFKGSASKKSLIKDSIMPVKIPFQELKGTIHEKPSAIRIIKKSINWSNSRERQAITASKKEIISKLRDNIRLDIEKPQIFKKPKQGYIKHFSEDGDALRKHGFKIKVIGEKEPEPKYIMPKPISHTKHSVLNHFREVYKHG